MAEKLIRIGKVSTVNAQKGMISVTYPDLDDDTTDEFPVFSFTDEYKMPQIGKEVLVLHLSNGQTAGIVLGRYWNQSNVPPVDSGFRKELGESYGDAYMDYRGGQITLHADKILLDAEVEATGDVKAGGAKISLINHTHTDSMGGTTSPPH